VLVVVGIGPGRAHVDQPAGMAQANRGATAPLAMYGNGPAPTCGPDPLGAAIEVLVLILPASPAHGHHQCGAWRVFSWDAARHRTSDADGHRLY
jgi:hypothetical protein